MTFCQFIHFTQKFELIFFHRMAIYSEAMKLGVGVEDCFDDEVSDSGSDCSIEEHDDFGFYTDTEQNTVISDQRDLFSPGTKSATQSLDAGVGRTPSRDDHGGPPRKIVMKRNYDEKCKVGSCENDQNDDTMSPDGSISSETSMRKRKGVRRRKRTPTPVLKRVDATSLNKASSCSDRSISDSISILKPIMQCSSPFGLVLDMKSRHVSRQVWALVIDFLRDSGARVEGIASFIFEEVRDITQHCQTPVNEIIFIHTAGDLQDGCHTGVIKRGEHYHLTSALPDKDPSELTHFLSLTDTQEIKCSSMLGHCSGTIQTCTMLML